MPGVFQLFAAVAMSFACVLQFAMSSSALQHHVFQNLHPVFFPVVRFTIRYSRLTRCTPLFSFREREKTLLGMGQYLPSGLGIAPTDRPSNFAPFGGRFMPQRLTA